MTTEQVLPRVKFRGGNYDAFVSTDPEFVLVGGAGTGKTRALLTRMNKKAKEYPGYAGLIVRKELVNLGRTALRTLEEEVLIGWDRSVKRSLDGVQFFGGSQNEPAAYNYPNGSRIVVGGMDQPRKVLGSQYSEIFANEITELTEEDWETLSGRARRGEGGELSMFGDCNPSYDRHWVLKRVNAGKMRMFKTVLRDNPAYFLPTGHTTELGAAYLARLQGMTGTRYQRFYLGEWVGMENAIYADLLDAPRQFVPIPDNVRFGGWGGSGLDYGRVHLSAITPGTLGSDGHLWIRACWAENGGGLQEIKDADRKHRSLYKVRYGVTDPIQEVLAQELGYRAAKGNAGSRKARIEIMRSLLADDIIRFDRYGPGMQELWDEMFMYRFEIRETDTSIDEVVVRKDEDRVASLEYLGECWNRYGPTTPRPQAPNDALVARARARREARQLELYPTVAKPVMRR